MSTLARAVGVAFVALVGVAAVSDARLYADRWDVWGPLAPGESLPDFFAPGLGGEDLRPASLEGQVTVLAFWATWCGPCGREMPALQAVSRDYADRGVQVIGVNRDREGDVPAKVAAYKAERGLDFDMVYDRGAMGQAFRVTMIPHLVIVDRQGQLRHVHQGQTRESKIREELDALLAEP